MLGGKPYSCTLPLFSLCGSGWTRTCYVAQVSLKLTEPLPLPPMEYWDKGLGHHALLEATLTSSSFLSKAKLQLSLESHTESGQVHSHWAADSTREAAIPSGLSILTFQGQGLC